LNLGGESVKEINRKSGAFVELDKSYVPAIGNSSDRIFKLRGTPEQIVAAQQLMYDKIINSPGGPGDMLTPIQFQQQFNLPLIGSNAGDSWNGNDANGASANDPYSQWANSYGQWPQSKNQIRSNYFLFFCLVNSYDNNTSTTNSSAAATDASGMDPAWLAYYQSMSYYNMMQASMTAATSTPEATDSTTTSNNNSATPGLSIFFDLFSHSIKFLLAVNPTTGQPDYSQQWIEYYRSIGQNDVADQIMQQMKAVSN
jgi:hypothetical protein